MYIKVSGEASQKPVGPCWESPGGFVGTSGGLLEAKEPPKEAPERPKSFKNLKKINVFGLLAFSLPMGF